MLTEKRRGGGGYSINDKVTFHFTSLHFTSTKVIQILFSRDMVMVFNATINNILVLSWRSVLVVEESGVPEKMADRPQGILQHNVVPSTPHLSRILTTLTERYKNNLTCICHIKQQWMHVHLLYVKRKIFKIPIRWNSQVHYFIFFYFHIRHTWHNLTDTLAGHCQPLQTSYYNV